MTSYISINAVLPSKKLRSNVGRNEETAKFTSSNSFPRDIFFAGTNIALLICEPYRKEMGSVKGGVREVVRVSFEWWATPAVVDTEGVCVR